MRMPRLLALAALGALILASAECASGVSNPTSPSPAPAPAPSPAPGPSPTPAPSPSPAPSGNILTPSFVVRSKSRGTGACAVDVDTQEFDCVFDGSASRASTIPISSLLWTFTMGSTTLRYTALAPNTISSPQGESCSLYQQGTGGDAPNGDRYLNMTVGLQLQDQQGTRSAIVQQAVQVYPNKQCGFSY
jgi:hypothetical protein